MSQQSLHHPEQTPFPSNKSIHLLKNNHSKNQLYRKIDIYLSELQGINGNQETIEILKMRKKLIQKYGLSVERIDNLERIFLHYCSHIFKTGKHMTFERLQYEKNHLTMDRFFVFLKDFGLTTAPIDGVTRQIVDKNQLVLIFKKMSINCKDLNFQQFISCIQRIAIVYYDAKSTYKGRQEKLAMERQKRKQNYMKSMKRRQAAMEAARSKLEGMSKDEIEETRFINNEEHNLDEQNNLEQSGVAKQEQEKGSEKINEELMNSKGTDHPEQEKKQQDIKHSTCEKQAEADETQKSAEAQEISNPNAQREYFDRHELLVLTPQEKIEYFYQLIDVDNALSFKKKMRELNLPLFQPKNSHRRAISHLATNPAPIVKESKMPEVTPEEQNRLDELRAIIEQKKERDRSSVPHMSKEDYEERRKKRIHEEQQVHIKRLPRQKKIEVSELQTDLSSLSKMEFDKINFRKFNPQKLYEPSQEDDAYLGEYYSVRKPQRSEKRITSTLDTTDKYSQALLQKLKKRTQEIESRERLQQSKYSVGQEVNASTQHQLRKNRLLQKLLKLQKS